MQILRKALKVEPELFAPDKLMKQNQQQQHWVG